MSFWMKGIKAKVMSTELIIEANVSKAVLLQALKYAQAFEKKFSAYKDDSLLNQVNNAAGIHSVPVNKEDIDIFHKAYIMAKTTHGIFDPTIGSLTQGLYGFGKQTKKIPTDKEIQKTKGLVNYQDIELSEQSIFLRKKGMRLDLGGIGKGYVADKIAEFLIKNRASKGFVSVGGEISAFGKKYKFAIKDPFNTNEIIALIKTSKQAISMATSGDYERFIHSQKHHHILHSKTGRQNYYYTSVTLLKNGLDATTLDALSTLIFNTPPQELSTIAENFKCTIIAITPQKKILFENYQDLDIYSIELFPF